MNESREQMRADIIQLLQELNINAVENDSVSNAMVCNDEKYCLSELLIRIKSLASMCRILSSKSMETPLNDINAIEDIQNGILCVSRELNECETIIQRIEA